jgi:hypothetical protein
VKPSAFAWRSRIEDIEAERGWADQREGKVAGIQVVMVGT